MNVTELARRLKVNTAELKELLPKLGFDIGKKAIKIDDRTAHKIIANWPNLLAEYQKKQADKRKQEQEKQEQKKEAKKIIKIPPMITVRELAAKADLPVNKILAELMKNSIFVSLNEEIDYDTAAIIGADLGIEVQLEEKKEDKIIKQDINLKDIIHQEDNKKLQPRPPVVVVMGHVDHGKTKLLDTIRKTNIVEKEAGGITQHIGAYQVERQGKTITFIDTPGHEAFTAMRSRGAKIADIAILVVAADDGVKPQTIEAFRIIEAAKLPFVVAINKIDKPEANIEKTKQELSSHLKIIPQDWGGDVFCVPLSAKTGQGIDDLLDKLLLVAKKEKQNLKANPQTTAVGTVVESHVSKGEGPVATIIIQNGTLKVGDPLSLGEYLIGRARALKNHQGQSIKSAGPSTPVKILGLKITPGVGDILIAKEGKKINLKKLLARQLKKPIVKPVEKEKEMKKIDLIIKTDVLGSAEAIEESLEKINTDEVKANILYKALGNITDGDIKRAEAENAQIVGFHVNLPPTIEELAREKGVKIKLYKVIYDLIQDIKQQMQEALEPEIKRTEVGTLKVLAVFKTSSQEKIQIIGGRVEQGQIEPNLIAVVIKNGREAGEGKITNVQIGKEPVDLVETGQECGLQYNGKPIIEVGDVLKLIKEEKITKTL